jgi:hypothetical protein
MKPIKTLLMLLTSAAMLAACGGSDDDFDDRADLADPKLRFVHAVEGAPAVTLFRNGVREADANAVNYRYASPYYDFSRGNTVLELRLASNNAVIASAGFDANRGNKYTAIAVPGATALQMLLIDDPYNKSVNSDDARVRFVNGSRNAQNVDVYITVPNANLANEGPDIAAVPFGQPRPASASDSVEFEGGTYQIRVTTAGTKTVIFDSGNLDIAKNADLLFVTLPTDGVGATPNDIKLLRVTADDPSRAANELGTQ